MKRVKNSRTIKKNRRIKTKKNMYIKRRQKGGAFPDDLNVNILDIGKDISLVAAVNDYLKDRKARGLKNWLVLYAGYDTETEMIRFANPNWIFFDRKPNKDNRFGFVGDITLDTIQLLIDNFKGLFDYIVFDDNPYYYIHITSDDNSPELIITEKLLQLDSILAKNGKLVFPEYLRDLQKVFIPMLKDYDSATITDAGFKITINNPLYYSPFKAGYGGQTTLDSYFSFYFKYKDILGIDFREDLTTKITDTLLNKIGSWIVDPKKLNIFKGKCSMKVSQRNANCKDEYADYYKEQLKKEDYLDIVKKYTDMWRIPTENPLEAFPDLSSNLNHLIIMIERIE